MSNDTILNGTTVAAEETVIAENATTEVKETVEVKSEVKAEATDIVKSFLDSLSPDYKESKALQNFKDTNDLAKSYLNLNSLLGKRVAEWSKSDVDGFLTKLGRPETSDKYTIPTELGDTQTAKLKDMLFKAGISQEQAKILADEFILDVRSKVESETKAYEELKVQTEADLKKEFGDAYNKRINVATKAIKELGGDELLNLINDSGLGVNSTVIKAFAKLGVDYLESDRIVQSDKSNNFGITPTEAQSMINSKLADTDFRNKYYTRSHPLHGQAVKEMQELFSMLGKK